MFRELAIVFICFIGLCFIWLLICCAAQKIDQYFEKKKKK